MAEEIKNAKKDSETEKVEAKAAEAEKKSSALDDEDENIEELFIPLEVGESPKLYKGSDGKAYLMAPLCKTWFSMTATKIPVDVQSSIDSLFKIKPDSPFTIITSEGAKRNTGSVSTEIKDKLALCRKQFSYIHGNRRLWFLKRSNLASSSVINLSSMTLIMAAMHRISEIARYKPEQLNRLLKSKENWLLHEFISLALDQFIDEIACEITHHEIMPTANKE